MALPFELPFHRTTVTGTLYIVATPIGNLEDITLRALKVLRECSMVACEDTRQTGKLLQHFGIDKPTVSYYDHNEAERSTELVQKLAGGATIALVSDAGTPLISDPGYRLVRAALDAGITVVPIPGASASLGALMASGLATDSFRFCGFLPPKTTQRHKILEDLKREDCTLIFYESPHRILDSLEDVAAVLPNRHLVLARELTKLHEEFLRGTAAEIHAALAARPSVKGEITLLIGKAEVGESAASGLSIEDAVRAAEQAGMARMDAIKHVAKERGLNKRDVYRLITES